MVSGHAPDRRPSPLSDRHRPDPSPLGPRPAQRPQDPPAPWPARTASLAAAALALSCFLPLGSKYLAYLSCGAVAVLALQRAGGLTSLRQQPGVPATLALCALMAVSLLWTPAPLPFAVAQLGVFALVLLAAAIARACPAEFAHRVLRCFGVIAAAVGTLSVIDHLATLPASLWLASSIQADGNQRIVTSLLLALGAAISGVQALASSTRWQRLLWSSAVLLALLGLASQDRRTGMVAVPVLLAVLLLARQRSLWRSVAGLLGVAVLTVAAWQASPSVRARFDEGLREVQAYQSVDATKTSWGMRLRLTEHTVAMVREAPWLGHGVGSWRAVFVQRVEPGLLISLNTTPHNEHLLMTAQLGLAGLALWLWLLAAQLLHAWRSGPPGYIALLVWTAVAWAGLFNVVLRDTRFALPLLLLAGFAGALARGPSMRLQGQPVQAFVQK